MGKEAFRKNPRYHMSIEMSIEDKQPKPGDMVVLVGLPPGFLDDLPLEEQFAISEMVGKAVKFCGIISNSRWERAELAFSDKKRGMNHTLYVDPSYIRAVK
jgi:hypothetical protein